MNSKPLPQNIEAEQSVLGSILIDCSVIDTVLNIITPDDFYKESHQKIYRAMGEMHKKNIPIDVFTLYDYMKSSGQLLEEVGGSSYLTLLTTIVPTTINVDYYAKIVKEKSSMRKLWEKGQRLIQAIENGSDQSVIDNIREKINKSDNANLNAEFKTESWREIIGSEEPELNYLIEDLILVGCLILLGGKPKVGKSLLGLLIALSIALGVSLWDKKVKQGGVLFISTEDGKIRLKKRIWKMIGNPNKYQPNFEFYINELNLSDMKAFKALKSKVLELKPKLIVLDPLINIFKKGELNSAGDMNLLLRPLQDLAKETGAAILVIHHARKSGSDDPLDTIQGSITITGVADGILILKSLRREDEEKKAVLEVILKDAEIPKKVILKLEDNLRWNLEGDFEQIEGKNLEAEILDALYKDPGGLTITTLMQITESDYKPIYRLLIKMEEEKKVHSDKVGKSHTKVFSLESEWKAKMESEKRDVTNGNDSNKSDKDSSLYKTSIVRSESVDVENEDFEIPEIIK